VRSTFDHAEFLGLKRFPALDGLWLLSRRPMVFLGERSYSIYLWQSVAQGIVIAIAPATAGMGRAVPTVTVAVVLADLCYRWLERPMIQRGRAITQRRLMALDAAGRH
jgi:peptidoglycan/LPS O-acetylase OafA/YrhL